MPRQTDCFEEYARLSLEIAFPQYVEGISKGESPDWQNAEKSIGIEVTNAFDQTTGFMYYVVPQYFGRTEDEIPQRIRDSFKGKFYFDKDDSGKLHGSDDGLHEGKWSMDQALEHTGAKLQKLNKNFSLFNCNCLYIFTVMFIEPDDLDYFCEKYNVLIKKYKEYFDTVFLFDWEILYMISDGTVKTYGFSEEELEYLNTQSGFEKIT